MKKSYETISGEYSCQETSGMSFLARQYHKDKVVQAGALS